MAKTNKKSEATYYTLQSQNVLSPDQTELFEMLHYAGVVIDPKVLKIVLDLLKINVAPSAIAQMLKSLKAQKYKKLAAKDKGPSGTKEQGEKSSTSARQTSGARLRAGAS
ncbi:unnamed protein product [Owenia fusiformis]|uniref:Uncharacterized protein n=1 Tax=Owenia fusiformis TaxID=6347 RepID=A0A8J1TN49_OWEFU|nr:unnamed protein product [Owenia fusiformis]